MLFHRCVFSGKQLFSQTFKKRFTGSELNQCKCNSQDIGSIAELTYINIIALQSSSDFSCWFPRQQSRDITINSENIIKFLSRADVNSMVGFG